MAQSTNLTYTLSLHASPLQISRLVRAHPKLRARLDEIAQEGVVDFRDVLAIVIESELPPLDFNVEIVCCSLDANSRISLREIESRSD